MLKRLFGGGAGVSLSGHGARHATSQARAFLKPKRRNIAIAKRFGKIK